MFSSTLKRADVVVTKHKRDILYGRCYRPTGHRMQAAGRIRVGTHTDCEDTDPYKVISCCDVIAGGPSGSGCDCTAMVDRERERGRDRERVRGRDCLPSLSIFHTTRLAVIPAYVYSENGRTRTKLSLSR
ncbi:hypothetical protein J6590_029096 [Homalodisca vitripennis]|nr:hypothetical protein J6590_029096 [Homalodisca vitripennis]